MSISVGDDSGSRTVTRDPSCEMECEGPAAASARDRSPDGGAGEQDEDREGLRPGQSIGHFTLDQEIGRGGMGVVYRAYDQMLNRPVAVKVLRADAGDNSTRLLREARAMAALSHPNVMPVYQAGRAGNQVFVAMALASGGTLRDWLRDSRRDWREIVDMFRRAGEGLAAAHAAGLVHRDFKPSNVMLTDDGRLLVSDFGLVRVVADDHEEGPPPGTPDVTITRSDQVLGTPRYMAPEQHRAQPVDARADQFSFCAALFEALYDRPAVEGNEYREVASRAVRGEISEPPAETGVPARVQRAIARGLHVEPDGRFPSMEALLDELVRDPRRQRIRVAVGIASAALLAAVVWIVVAMANEQPSLCPSPDSLLEGTWDAAHEQSVRTAFLASGLPFAADAWRGVETALDGRADEWRAMRGETCAATYIQRDQSEALHDLRIRCLERRRREMSALIEVFAAEPDRETIENAVAAVQELPPVAACADTANLQAIIPLPDDPRVREQVDRIQREADRSRALYAAGKHDQALAIGEQLVARAESLDHAPIRAEVLALHTRHRLQLRDADETESLVHTGIQEAVKAGDAVSEADLWITLIMVVGLEKRQRDRALLLERMAEVAVLRARGGDALTGRLHHAVAMAYSRAGQPKQAVARYQRCIERWERSFGPDSLEVARALSNMSGTLIHLAEYDRAQGALQRAIELQRGSLGSRHPAIATSLHNLGNLQFSRGLYREARQTYEDALELKAEAHGPDHLELADTLSELGWVLGDLGEFDRGQQTLERALAIYQREYGAAHQTVLDTLGYLGVLHGKAHRLDDAMRQLERVQEMARELYPGGDDISVAIADVNAGMMANRLGRHDRAERDCRRGLPIIERVLGDEHPYTAEALTCIGDAELARNPTAAVAKFERALAILTARGSTDAEAARARFGLAHALWRTRQDRTRAVSVAREARRSLAGLDTPAETDLRVDIERWLASRTSR